LALKRKDGTLIPLVRSQVVHMPRPHPAIAIEQRFMKVESTEHRAEIVPPPPVERERRPEIEIAVSSVNDLFEETPISKPSDSEEIAMEELESVYVPQEWHDDRSEPDDAAAAAASTAVKDIRDFDRAP